VRLKRSAKPLILGLPTLVWRCIERDLEKYGKQFDAIAAI